MRLGHVLDEPHRAEQTSGNNPDNPATKEEHPQVRRGRKTISTNSSSYLWVCISMISHF